MKKNRLRFSLYAVMLAFFCIITVRTVQAASSSVVMKASTKNSITVSWTPEQDSKYYTITGYRIWDDNKRKSIYVVKDPKASSATITGLPSGYKSEWTVYYIAKARSGERMRRIGSCDVNTSSLPGIKVSQFGLCDTKSEGKVKVQAKNPYESQIFNANIGIQIRLYRYKNGKWQAGGTCTGSGYSEVVKTDYIKVSPNTAYRYQIRYYTKNSSNGKTYYGAWSGYRYFAVPGVKIKGTATAKTGITFQLKKGTGIKSYKLYLSTDKKNWSCVKTVNVTSKSKSTIDANVKKYKNKSLKSGSKYYYQIVPYVTGTKKSDAVEQSFLTVRSSSSGTGSGTSGSGSSGSSGASGSISGKRRCNICSGSGRCRTCYGQGGEWVYGHYGTIFKKKWVRCLSCGGSGSCKYCVNGWKY